MQTNCHFCHAALPKGSTLCSCCGRHIEEAAVWPPEPLNSHNKEAPLPAVSRLVTGHKVHDILSGTLFGALSCVLSIFLGLIMGSNFSLPSNVGHAERICGLALIINLSIYGYLRSRFPWFATAFLVMVSLIGSPIYLFLRSFEDVSF